ncbi:hypothetical protein BX616_006577, partial [Lobosporangium transversale]
LPRNGTSNPTLFQENFRGNGFYCLRGQLDATDHEKKKTLLFTECFELAPISLITKSGVNHTLLGHVPILDELSADSPVALTVASTQLYKNQDKPFCSRCSSFPSPGLEGLLRVSPYAKLLLEMKFVELSEDNTKILNEDWVSRPYLKHVCARMFAGSILHNKTNNQAVMINCLEIFGRKKEVDAHREPFRLIKGHAPQTSIPPFGKKKYPDVWPLTMNSKDGDRLVIGTQAFNILVTSCIRLDEKVSPSLGGMTTCFSLKDTESSRATAIFLDCESVQEAYEIYESKKETKSNQNEIEQMRQLRSKFNHISTFYSSRASSNITKSHNMQPYTVFTLSGHDSLESGSGRAAAILFNEIAIRVKDGKKHSKLKLRSIKSALELCKNTGKIKNILENIAGLFQDKTSVRIIGNKDLNTEL